MLLTGSWNHGNLLPFMMTIDLTDYQGLSLGRIYTEKDLEDITGISAENTGIYFRNSTLNDGETNLQTTSSEIGWAVEFDLPPILRGDYYITFTGQVINQTATWFRSYGMALRWVQSAWYIIKDGLVWNGYIITIQASLLAGFNLLKQNHIQLNL